jgi:predicted nucleic acid-binding protein
MKSLLDASAVLQVIKSLDEDQALRVFAENHVLDLTKYEVGNGIWKEFVLHRAIEADEFYEFLRLLRTVVARAGLLVPDPETLSNIGEIAAKEKMTFYDASYIALAKIRKLSLTTEDAKLAKAATKYVKTRTTKELIT